MIHEKKTLTWHFMSQLIVISGRPAVHTFSSHYASIRVKRMERKNSNEGRVVVKMATEHLQETVSRIYLVKVRAPYKMVNTA